MPKRWTPLFVALLAAACSDNPGTGPAEEPVRTLVVHQLGTQANDLLNTDGTAGGSLTPTTQGMLPIGSYAPEGLIALLDGKAIVLTTLTNPGQIDTAIQPAPSSQSLATFSDDGKLMAVVAYAPTPGILVYDRVNRRVDTLSLNGADPALPPVFAPDGDRIALFTVNQLSIMVTLVYRSDRSRSSTEQLTISKILNQPLFGWPRWVEDGVRMAFRRVAADGPDTLVVGILHPDAPSSFFEEAYRAVLAPVSDERPELDFGIESTYAISSDGQALALGAIPEAGVNRHAIYLVTPGVPRVQLVLDSPDRYLVFPLFVRE